MPVTKKMIHDYANILIEATIYANSADAQTDSEFERRRDEFAEAIDKAEAAIDASLTTPPADREENERLRQRVKALADIVPPHCSGFSFVFEGGSLHVRKDGSGYIVVDEDDFVLEDDRCEGLDGPEGSVHWIARFPAGEMTALRGFLNGQQFTTQPAPQEVERLKAEIKWLQNDLAGRTGTAKNALNDCSYWQKVATAAEARVKALEEAGKNVISGASDAYRKRNGQIATLEDDSGEKSWIVPYETLEDLRAALKGVEA